MPLAPTTAKSKRPRITQKAQIAEKDAKIAELTTLNSALSADLLQLQNDHTQFSIAHQALLDRTRGLSLANKALNCLKRKAQTAFDDELGKKTKRIKRLERERDAKKKDSIMASSGLQNALDDSSVRIAQLEQSIVSVNTKITSKNIEIQTLQINLKDRQSTITAIRGQLYASRKRVERAKNSLQAVCKSYRALQTWDPTEHGQFHPVSRKLARDLTYAGCSAGKVAFAVESCAQAFNIKIKRCFMGRRTVGRVIDEGGKYGELQLAREIFECTGPPGFVESSDGTTHRGITIESRHVTLLTPSYEPDIDDTDQSTWRHRTRFVEVAPALDHTGQCQFEGTREAATRIADTYSRSPLAAQERRLMDKNVYWRKKLGESKGHAADGKKECKISAAHKKDVIICDMGRAAIHEADVATSTILLAILEITDVELQAAAKISQSQLTTLPPSERSQLIEEVLERKIGKERFERLSPTEKSNATTHVFGGCCMHKDLNVVEFGVKEMQKIYSEHNIPPPVLLANKANNAAINLSTKDSTSPASQHAIDSSSSGAIKLLQLVGSFLRHKDGEHGYQDKTRIVMRERKKELYDLDEATSFPDVSNMRYGCYTYAAAEVVVFHGLIAELVTEGIDAKTKSGQPNHMEKNILKGLNCKRTMEQLIVLALYGAYPINLLSLTDIHRKLPIFCAHISENPKIPLDPSTPLDKLTINGRPIGNELLIPTICQLAPDLPHLFLTISKIFGSCKKGWIQFTPEFHVGGTFDCLTPKQRAVLFIPSTNDCSEGMLGSPTVHMRYHPNSIAESFSNQTRLERNNTEAFIKKGCDAAVERYVIREVRKDGAKGRRAKFRRAWAALQQEKAETARKRREKTTAKKKLAQQHLADTNLEFNISKIEAMSSPILKDQLRVYRDVLKDEVPSKILWKDMNTVGVHRELVLEAGERELERR
ncbi:hypothetical protein C8R43DRAFT_899318 [Mycena crocata]|nr:hypothetical protein C8R43DRAFT_899318 [Mycena crocata]